MDGDAKNRALEAMAAALRAEQHDVLAANAEDVAQARAGGRDEAFIDRLALTAARIDAIADTLVRLLAFPTRSASRLMRAGCRMVSRLPAVVCRSG